VVILVTKIFQYALHGEIDMPIAVKYLCRTYIAISHATSALSTILCLLPGNVLQVNALRQTVTMLIKICLSIDSRNGHTMLIARNPFEHCERVCDDNVVLELSPALAHATMTPITPTENFRTLVSRCDTIVGLGVLTSIALLLVLIASFTKARRI
jgi:hypothetical protein